MSGGGENDQNPERDMRLDAIVDYEMDQGEAAAYKIMLIWLDKSRAIFPDYQHNKTKTVGDPRKSQIFKYCFKLQRETQGILEETDYPLYVRAQLEILKHISKSRKQINITPNCLTGEKAWIRWKMWKRRYDEKSKAIEQKVVLPAHQAKVAEALIRSKENLVKLFGGAPTEEKFRECVINNNLIRWVNMGKVSPYYIALSPWVKKHASGLKFSMDIEVFRQAISKESEDYFGILFPDEV